MASMNKVFLVGNLTRDPETRYTPSGAAVCELGLATNRRFTTRDGKEQEEVCFADVTVFGKQAEACGQYLRKGSPVLVEGRLTYDSWDDRETGKKRSKLGVTAERVQFLGSADGGDSGGTEARGQDSRRGGGQAARYEDTRRASGGGGDPFPGDGGGPPPDDEIPFRVPAWRDVEGLA